MTPGFTVNSGPQGILAGPDGALWFGECNNPVAIGRITTAGVVNEFSTGLTANSCPAEITVGPDGNLWFTEASNPARIGRINPTTGAISEFSTGLTPTGSLFTITNGPDGNLWFTEFANPGRIGKITPSGAITEVATGGVTPGFSANSNPSWIVAGPDGHLWFTEQSNPSGPGRIGRLDPATGSVEEFPTPTVNSAPSAMAVGPDGNLRFTEFGASSIGQITTPPSAATAAAPATGQTTATVSGTANGHAQATSFHVEYGPVGGATTTTADQSLGTTSGDTPVSTPLTGLTPSTTYQARVVVTNPTGTTGGAFLTFTTAAPAPVPVPVPVPTVSTLRVSPGRFSLAGRKVKGRCVKPTKGNSHSQRCRRPIMLRIRYTLNVAATVTFTLKLQALGRKVKPLRQADEAEQQTPEVHATHQCARKNHADR